LFYCEIPSLVILIMGFNPAVGLKSRRLLINKL